MTNSFRKIFQLDFFHNYFGESSHDAIFKVRPMLSNSIALLQKNRLNGFFTFIREISASSRTSTLANSYETFYFPLEIIDNNFLNYTKIDYQLNKVILFSNEKIKGSTISGDSGKMLDIRSSQFIFPLELSDLKLITSVNLINPIDQIESLPLPLAPYRDGYPVELSGEREGKYELHIDFGQSKKKIIYSFFYSNSLFHNPTPFIFEFKINLFKYVTNLKSKSYTLMFQSRKTYWRYLFVGLEQKDWDSVKISPVEIDNKYAVFKKLKEAILLENGQFAFEAFSTMPIPLQHRPNWKIRLSSNRIPEGVLLPFPQPSSLTFPAKARKSKQPHSDFLISEIYCYF